MHALPGFLWYCKTCLLVKQKEADFKVAIEQTLQSKLSDFELSFETFKNDISMKFGKAQHAARSSPTFAQIVDSRSAVVITPKEPLQAGKSTKSEAFSKINPADSSISINRVRSRKDGGIVVGCRNSEDVKKFCDLAKNRLAENFVVREVHTPQPKIKIVGITEELSEEELIQCLKIQNEPYICSDSDCKILKFWHTKNNNHIFQAIVELDIATYKRLLEKISEHHDKRLLVGYDSCVMYDALEPTRCFNCSGFNHTSKNCNTKKACPKCSQEHDLSDCESSALKCINCLNNSSSSSNSTITVGHAALDKNCPIYKNKLSGFRARILGRP